MKTKSAFFAIGILIIINSCKENISLPVVKTLELSEISYTTTISGGEVIEEGGYPVINRGICWNIFIHPTIIDNKTVDGEGLGKFTSNITNLTPNTTYYIRAYASNKFGTAYGNEISFSTLKIDKPTLTTSDVTSITQTTAISGGNITNENGGEVTERGVCWGIAENPTVNDNGTKDGTGLGSFTSTLSGLTGNTMYYVRAYAVNSAGIEYGNQISFKTAALLPTVKTLELGIITYNSATVGKETVSDGGATITSSGICWDTSHDPTTDNNIVSMGISIGRFTSILSDLSSNTTYYLRAYASNSAGTAYGDEIEFTLWMNTQDAQVTDIEGNIYNSVRIGDQTWMQENLRTTKYSNGDNVETTDPLTLNITSESLPKYQWIYDGNIAYLNTFGRLYTGDVVVDNRNICPIEWHVPTNEEWKTLIYYLGGISESGGKLKETGTAHWNSPNEGSSNISGFSGLPGGIRSQGGLSQEMSQEGYWWSSTKYDANSTWNFNLESFTSKGNREISWKNNGFSVRCIKD